MSTGNISEHPIVVGLDIGTTKIAVFVGQKDQFGKINILGMGRADSHGVMRGEVVNIDKTVASIRQAVAEAEEKSGVDIRSVYVGIAGHHISSKQNRGIYTLQNPDAEITSEVIRYMEEDMFRVALEPGEKIIHVIPQEFTVDSLSGISDPVGICGSRIEANFHIITGKVAAAHNIKKCVERAGLNMIGLILEPLASSASVLSDQEMEAGVALVDIGGGTTDIALFKENIIRHTAVIPFAGNIITEDIKDGCRVLKRDAERLKLQFGSALPDEVNENSIIAIPGIAGHEKREISMKTLSKVIHARMEEIIEQVYFELKSSGYANKLIAGLVVTGGGSQLKHLKQMVEFTTGLSTRIGFPTEHIAKDTPAALKNPMYATGIGLILKGYEIIERNQMYNTGNEARKSAPLSDNGSARQDKTADMQPQQPAAAPKKWRLGYFIDSMKNWFEDANVYSKQDFNQ